MKRRKLVLHHSITTVAPALAIALTLGVLSIGLIGSRKVGVVREQQFTASAQTTGMQPMSSQEGTVAPARKQLDVTEWGVQVSLPADISDAYYVRSTSTIDPLTGQPNTIWLGLASLNNASCDALSFDRSGSGSPVGAIIRVAPTDTDPVSGALYTQKYSGGVTVAGYYYAYVPWKNNTCASKTALQNIDSAFGGAVKGLTRASMVAQ